VGIGANPSERQTIGRNVGRRLVTGLGLGLEGEEDSMEEGISEVAAVAGGAYTVTTRSSIEGDRRAKELTESPLADVTEAFNGLGTGWGASPIVSCLFP
jgi:hypothetical protein